MESALWQQILDYGALGVLTVLFFLFSRGYIVSRATLEQAIKAHKETIERIVADNTIQREAYEKTLDKLAQSHSQTINQLCISYQQTIGELKAIIAVVRRSNGKKPKKE